ncbi:TonB-dependent receptor [Novosphingobium guangzhouense]|uniref:TonB-dependent receptor n=2 Tax=Novosphingobium guangzhouense TaxID=1850347 RepID=A0A2K2G6U1_9SPHN|nr:TonB-dependent receptor [Novosphingobium guangzhouense]
MGAAGVSVLALLAAACPSFAWAADADTADGAAAEGGGPIGEIVVSAERTNVTLQKASLSVTAVTDDTLNKANITEITGLNGTVPGLVVAKSGGGERMISIRGIGSETPENPSTQPGVSFHIDGVYIFNSIAANAAFIDIAQVEVLRGPQGTMYGQGSTGGTINVVSKQPDTSALSGSVNLGYGNYDMFKSDAAINVPITGTLAIRAAGQRLRHDGYAKATDVAADADYELDDADEWGGKLAVKWTPTDRISVLLSTIQYKGDQNATAQKNILDPNPDPRELTQDFPGKTYIRTQLYYGVVRFDLGGATFSSITSYQKLHSDLSWDGDGLNRALFAEASEGLYTYDHIASWEQNTRSWTQEYNLASNGDGPLRWIVGGVYLRSKNGNYINEYRDDDGAGLNPPLATSTPFNDAAVKALTYAELSGIVREAYAGYAQGSLAVTDALTVTAGIRYNHDKYSGVSDSMSGGVSGQTSGAYLQPARTVGTSTGRLTGKFALDYQLTPDNMIYASYTRGFKPGGINSSAASGNSSYTVFQWDTGVKPTYKPETLDSIEIGSKNRFFGDTLQINASAFYYFYKDLQFLEEDAVLFGEGISNAPKAEVYGAELEMDWHPAQQLRLEGSLSLLQGKFTGDYMALSATTAGAVQNAAGYLGITGFYANFYAASLVREAARVNINGNKIPKMPSVQGSAAVSWTGELGPGEFTARAQYIYRGTFQSRVFNTPVQDDTPDYSQVNLFASYAIADTGISVSATVTNLFDKDGVNSRFTDPYGSGQVSDTYIAPRQAIFSVGYKF